MLGQSRLEPGAKVQIKKQESNNTVAEASKAQSTPTTEGPASTQNGGAAK
jgi:hypothetical protein